MGPRASYRAVVTECALIIRECAPARVAVITQCAPATCVVIAPRQLAYRAATHRGCNTRATSPSFALSSNGKGLLKEVTVATLIPAMPQINHRSQPRWERCARADRFEQYREWRSPGVSARQAAQALKGPRTTLQAWRMRHDGLAICPHVAACLQSGPGLAFLPRLVIRCHLVCVAVGACGMRVVCLCLHLTGLDRFVAAS
jgi:hypothetical protein